MVVGSLPSPYSPPYSPPPLQLGRRVYVGGLPPHASWQGLKDHFRQARLRHNVI